MKPLKTVSDFVNLWESRAALAAAIVKAGMPCERHQPRDWAIRGVIPPEYQHAAVKAAHESGFTEVTSELIDRLHAPPKMLKRKRGPR